MGLGFRVYRVEGLGFAGLGFRFRASSREYLKVCILGGPSSHKG